MSNTCLLVMDFQNSIVERLGTPSVVAAAARAVDAARANDIPVLFVRVAFRDGYPEVAASNRMFSGMAERGGPTSEAHPSVQITSALEPRAGEPIVTKRRVSAFAGSDLDVLLRAGRVDHLVLAGIATSGVVLSTLRQAADLDFELTVLSDACADRDAEVHRVLTEKVFPRQADVTTVDEWASRL